MQTRPASDAFPTLYYLTCARLNSRIGGLEADGRMREMTERLDTDPELADAYRRAHESYLAERDAIEPLGTQVTAGGMPDRVKCLHVHVAHALAAGPGEPLRRRPSPARRPVDPGSLHPHPPDPASRHLAGASRHLAVASRAQDRGHRSSSASVCASAGSVPAVRHGPSKRDDTNAGHVVGA